MTSPRAEADRARALSILRRHARSVVSFQLLEPAFTYFFDDAEAAERAGFVAYVDTGGAWVAGGAPVGPDDRRGALARAFAAAARDANRRACFFAVEPAELEALGLASMLLGEQPFWDPHGWELVLEGNASLRYQLRRARKKGVRVRGIGAAELANPRSAARRGVERVIERWQRARPMAPMGFLVDLQPFGFAAERMTFVAERGGRAVGFVAAVPIFARRGWFLEDVVRADDAPNGTIEALVDAAMREAASRGAAVVTMGLAPLSGDIARPLALVRSLSRGLYDFRGLRAFKQKLSPSVWEPVYLCTSGSPWIALYDALVAFARGSMIRFGVRTLLRGPDVVVRALAFALGAWTVVAATTTLSWQPSGVAKWGWILAHLGILAALGSLLRRHRGWLAVALAVTLGVDAAATLAWLSLASAMPARGAFVTLLTAGGLGATSASVWAMSRRRPGS